MKKTLILLLGLLCHSVLAGTPSEALDKFKKAAKEKKLEEAWKHTAQFEGASEELIKYLQSRITRILDIAGDGWDIEILEEKVSGDCAVVVVNESSGPGDKGLDIDPAYLMKQNGEWKVLPHITIWDFTQRIPADKQPPSMRLDQSKIAAYQELESWFDERKKILKKKAAE